MSKVKIQGNASGTGVVTLTAPNTDTDRTITLPDSTGTVLDSTSTLDATKLSGDLPAIDGSSLTGISGGKVLQVVENTDDSPSTTSTTSTSWTTTGYSITITPSATSSKIYLAFSTAGFCPGNNNDEVHFGFFRGATSLGSGSGGTLIQHAGANSFWRPVNMIYVDSPNSTSAITYTVKFKTNQGNTSYSVKSAVAVSLVAMEIGA